MTKSLLLSLETFSVKTSLVACYVEQDGKVLLLRSSSEEKEETGLWSVPVYQVGAGKVPLQVAMRALERETGIKLEKNGWSNMGCRSIGKAEVAYHMFRLKFACRPEIQLQTKFHEEYRWVSIHELEILPLKRGQRAAYRHYCQALPGAEKRRIASVSSYLILNQEEKILLGLRQNTGYSDGMWSLPAGHVEEGEPASHGMIREAEEELGIRLDPLHLKAVHLMHRQSNRLNVDIFFTSQKWDGDIENREPEKCAQLSFFPLSALPENLVSYNRQALKHFKEGLCYSELGWD